MDQCKNCVVRGDIKKCAATECAVHDSWFVTYLCKTLLDCEPLLAVAKSAVTIERGEK